MSDMNFEKLLKTETNLIPDKGQLTGSYFCTWWSQSGAASGIGLDGGDINFWRDALCQEAVFDTEKYYHPAEKSLREGLIFLLDDGWDIPIEPADGDARRPMFGAVDPDKVKFARFGSTPEERLAGMSKKTKEMGYAGLGLWISPQMSSLKGEDESDDPKEYWERRARWCHNAGVLYWKVDWGNHDYDDEYRALITDCVHRCAPEIFVEHAVVQKPCTHHHPEGDFIAHRTARVRRQMEYSDVYRTYDVLEPFDKVCTLERAHEAFLAGDIESHRGKGLVNGENIYTVVAALGLCAGIMNYNVDAKACINWQRIAPPFSIFESKYTHSEEFLTDTLFFDTEICGWAPCKGRVVCEKAPAIMARGCPLPTVRAVGENVPYVIASKHPVTEAYAVATVRRSVDPISNSYFLADVEITDASVNAPVGVFGVFNSLKISFNETVSDGAKILAQDLAGDSAYDITSFGEIGEDYVKLPGKLMRYLGKISRGHSNWSEPSIVIKVEK